MQRFSLTGHKKLSSLSSLLHVPENQSQKSTYAHNISKKKTKHTHSSTWNTSTIRLSPSSFYSTTNASPVFDYHHISHSLKQNSRSWSGKCTIRHIVPKFNIKADIHLHKPHNIKSYAHRHSLQEKHTIVSTNPLILQKTTLKYVLPVFRISKIQKAVITFSAELESSIVLFLPCLPYN